MQNVARANVAPSRPILSLVPPPNEITNAAVAAAIHAVLVGSLDIETIASRWVDLVRRIYSGPDFPGNVHDVAHALVYISEGNDEDADEIVTWAVELWGQA